jgi:prefoldin subunit 2
MTNKKNQEEVVQGFNSLRNDQKAIAQKQNDLRQDLNEHTIVIDTLEGVDQDRKCFRMVGGVLVERTVKEVIPALVNNKDKMGKLISSLDGQLTEKGEDIASYMEKHNIQVKGNESKKEVSNEEEVKTGGVLVPTQD